MIIQLCFDLMTLPQDSYFWDTDRREVSGNMEPTDVDGSWPDSLGTPGSIPFIFGYKK